MAQALIAAGERVYDINPRWTALARRRQEGKSWKEALRALKRFILRAVWRLWQRCLQGEQPAPVAVAA